jgi:hypothetical protein
MNPDPGREKIRISMEDLDRISLPAAETPAGTRSYGNVQEPVLQPAAEEPGSFFRKAWFYLGAAGFAGAVLAWAVCEPAFSDGGHPTWANIILFPLMLILICVAFGIAESIVEHSPRKAVIRGLLSLGLGTVLGFVFFFIANIIYSIGLAVLSQNGGFTIRSPALWITRGIAWMGFGVAGGVVYGIVGQSSRRCLYGIAGGVLGAGLGGALFDPITILTGGAGLSRAVGMALFGMATGIAVGLVESALKDRWLYVSAGPLAGKQFILYKPVTTIGSDQSCDIYLFKDPAIQQHHSVIELRGPRTFLRAAAPVQFQGRPVAEAVLQTGSAIQVGRYTFQYRDRERAIR